MKKPLYNFISEAITKLYNAPKPYKAKPNMRPSTLGSACLRRIFYNYLRVKPDYGWTWQRIKNFEKGDAIHGVIQSWFAQAGILIPYRNKDGSFPKHWKTGLPDKEFPVTCEDLDIRRAKADGLLLIKEVPGVAPGLWILEIKSMNDKRYRELDTQPKEVHEEQAMTYCYLFEDNLKKGKYSHVPELQGKENESVAGVIFVYVNREDDEDDWKEFHIQKRPEPFMKVAEKVVEVHGYVKRDELPPKTEDFCPWCEFRDKCAREQKS